MSQPKDAYDEAVAAVALRRRTVPGGEVKRKPIRFPIPGLESHKTRCPKCSSDLVLLIYSPKRASNKNLNLRKTCGKGLENYTPICREPEGHKGFCKSEVRWGKITIKVGRKK